MRAIWRWWQSCSSPQALIKAILGRRRGGRSREDSDNYPTKWPRLLTDGSSSSATHRGGTRASPRQRCQASARLAAGEGGASCPGGSGPGVLGEAGFPPQLPALCAGELRGEDGQDGGGAQRRCKDGSPEAVPGAVGAPAGWDPAGLVAPPAAGDEPRAVLRLPGEEETINRR